MLDEIRKNPKTIIQPEVEQIEAWTLEYIGSTSVVPRGGWSWDLRFVIEYISSTSLVLGAYIQGVVMGFQVSY